MTPLNILLAPQSLPFAIALGLVAGMLALELLLMLVGGSLMGGEPDVDLDVDPTLDFGADASLDVGADFDLGAEPDAEFGLEEADISGGQGLLSWLGLGEVPFAIWLAGVLTAFGLAGYGIQMAANALIGAPLPLTIAPLVALPVALGLGARLARIIGRLVPKFETTAISHRSYGGRRGVITVGTARRGHPAQARFTDGHGNTHYVMVEPLHDDQTFARGSEIAILRLQDGTLRAIGLDDA